MSETMQEHARVYGEFVVSQPGRGIIARGHNKLTGAALRTLVNLLGGFTGYSLEGPLSNTNNHTTMNLGTGGGVTTDATTALTTSVATLPSSKGFSRDNPSTGVYRAILTGTWNAGTLSSSLAAATVTELGITGCLYSTLTSASTHTTGLWSRLSAADGEFAGFTVDHTKPLVIEYRVVFTF